MIASRNPVTFEAGEKRKQNPRTAVTLQRAKAHKNRGVARFNPFFPSLKEARRAAVIGYDSFERLLKVQFATTTEL